VNDDELRRLLADARHDDPVPDDVAARLDRVLAGLADEDQLQRPRVVDLATARRRRRARNLLVAAAAVVAVGVGLGQLDLSSSGGDSDGASSSADAGGSGELESAASAAPSDDLAAAEDRAEDRAGDLDSVVVAAEPVRIGDDDFSELARTQAQAPPAAEPLQDAEAGAGAARRSWFDCRKASFGRGRLVAVEYRGSSAVLAVRPPTGDSVVVELLQCGTATVLRSATVPLP